MLTLEQVRKIKWYRQSGAGITLCVGLAFIGGLERMPKKTGLWFPNDLACFLKTKQGHAFYHYFDYALTLEEAKKIMDKVTADIEFFWQLKKDFYPAGDHMEKVGRELLKESLSSEEFYKKYDEFIEYSLKFWEDSVFIDLLDPFEEKIIEFIFGDRKKELSKENLNLLLSPDDLSQFQKEQKELLDIAESRNAELLKNHSDKYYWLKNDYEKAEYLDEKYYKNEMFKLINKPRLAEDIRIGLKKFGKTQKTKKELLNKLSFDEETLKRLNFFNWVTTFRDDRKKYCQISNYILIEIIKKISKEKNIDIELLKNVMSNEIKELMKGEEEIFRILETRKEGGVLLYSDKPADWGIESGKIAREYFEILEKTIQASEIKGTIASAGKAIGPVKIILNQSDFGKMRKGDVLVASMTRPEYVPIMKKAVAIVTDEGGITSHAAIVSRELGIPCITGTQVATRSLKDGDLIDVDANHGSIKLIKKA